jgi:DNA-binding GntR family transcriptional regulator
MKSVCTLDPVPKQSTPKVKGRVLKRDASMAGDVFARLVEALVTGKFPAGEPLREAQVAKQWGVSRTPMREAVRRAAEAGLLILRKNRAPLIRAFTPHDVDCLYQIREMMEVLAMKQAWHRLPEKEVAALQAMAESVGSASSRKWISRCLAFDEALHKIWFDHCQNPWLTQFLQSSRVFIRIFQHMMACDPALVRNSYDQHLAILNTLGTSDLQLGTRLLRDHIRDSALKVKQHMEGPGGQSRGGRLAAHRQA